ncbi:hypothetical protein [Clostridium chauvoei]|nr:hypothetical protein [Clostridium chauvoei]
MKSRNKRIACISAIALATSLAYNGTVAFAGTKNEVVFITMDSNGDTKI